MQANIHVDIVFLYRYDRPLDAPLDPAPENSGGFLHNAWIVYTRRAGVGAELGALSDVVVGLGLAAGAIKLIRVLVRPVERSISSIQGGGIVFVGFLTSSVLEMISDMTVVSRLS